MTKGEEEKPCPISVDCWMSYLSNKINNWTVIFYTIATMSVTLIIVLLSIAIAVFQYKFKLSVEQAPFAAFISIICVSLALLICLTFFSCRHRLQKIVKPLEKITGKIIAGELNTPNEIREEWKNKIRPQKKKINY